MAVQRKLMTAEEFAQLPNDDSFQELVRGEVRTSPPPGEGHGEVAAAISSLVYTHVRREGLGRVTSQSGYRLARDPDTVRAPDVAFVRADRLPEAPEGYPELAPDLVVEVVSPSDTAADVQERMQEWLRHGARLVWAVYPRTRSVAVHEPGQPILLLGPEDVITGGEVLPGFSARVADFFPA